MAFTQPIQKLPVHVISEILGCLDNWKQLAIALQSHRVFNNAFKDGPDRNRQEICRKILLNQVATRLLPYAVASLESSRRNGDFSKIDKIISDYLVDTPSETFSPLEIFRKWEETRRASVPRMTDLLSDYVFMTREYALITSLRIDMASEIIPVLKQYGIEKNIKTMTPTEIFRFDRAFFSALTCFHCCPLSHFDGEKARDKFELAHSSWVNEQMMCVHAFLSRKLTNLWEMYTMHDVSMTDARPDRLFHQEYNMWFDERGILCDDESTAITWLLSQGLYFISEAYRATDHKTLSRLFRFPTGDSGHALWSPNELGGLSRDDRLCDMVIEPHVKSCKALGEDGIMLQRFASQRDGDEDQVGSDSFCSWMSAHYVDPCDYPDTRYDNLFVPNEPTLWNCAYVMWDFKAVASDKLDSVFKKM
ncbi:hypothetical protein FCIRC_8974 [Fusarium circinatum]|uniref:F-box domain-containing protein n=1 Tax=Fusarium circinatum TaxID=48490 RepID=A0A8H5WSA6_FUSCI|nr:hypothetical protein FCIRC_8974 [Fusarium circinatum]